MSRAISSASRQSFFEADRTPTRITRSCFRVALAQLDKPLHSHGLRYAQSVDYCVTIWQARLNIGDRSEWLWATSRHAWRS